MEKIYLVSSSCAAAYDGANGDAIVREFTGVVVADDGVTLRYADQGYDPVETPAWPVYEATVGQYVRWYSTRGEGASQPAETELLGFPIMAVYTAEQVDARLAQLEARITALEES